MEPLVGSVIAFEDDLVTEPSGFVVDVFCTIIVLPVLAFVVVVDVTFDVTPISVYVCVVVVAVGPVGDDDLDVCAYDIFDVSNVRTMMLNRLIFFMM
jgi:hypothetical protein